MSIVGNLKSRIKQKLIERQQNNYAAILHAEQKGYDSWIREKENRLDMKKIGNLSMTYLSYSKCGSDIFTLITEVSEDIIVFRADIGHPSEIAEPLIEEFMTAHPAVDLVYGDEDYLIKADLKDEYLKEASLKEAYLKEADLLESDLIEVDLTKSDLVRSNPWFKPDWSPDTFLDRFYFGSIFAVRRETAIDALEEMRSNGAISSVPEDNLYTMCHGLAEKCGGFDKRSCGNVDNFPIGHISEVLFHGQAPPRQIKGRFNGEYGNAHHELITVVIPSKDHPDILKRCLLSFIRNSKDNRYHFIVVDNGSSENNKNETEFFLKKLNEGENFAYPPVYLYQDMPFNFSRMCNMGAAAAPEESELLLFLNDDMEIIQEDWLDRLTGKAVLPRVGAVGAKLIYPETDIIQHAGITNIRIGPIHKLQYQSDNHEYYFGKNRGVHNVAAVTGACLMVRKSVFIEAGGFPEELAVAFNDVDLCYSIWEAGYVNVILNDVMLYHHESLSRGNDGEDEEKITRLEKEKDLLYRRHRGLYAKDPFYHKYLIADVPSAEYLPALHNEADLGISWSLAVADSGKVLGCPVDACLRVGVEYATDLFKWKYGVSADDIVGEGQTPHVMQEDRGYYFHGYAFVIGGNNACYERILLLKEQDKRAIWRIPIAPKYRPDIGKALPDQLNVDLTGFAAKIKDDAVPPGKYLIGMMVKDRCSRQRIVNWSEKSIVI